jgi:hypothetical protein
MSNKLKQLFQNINELNPPKVLADFIFSRIEREKIRKAKRQLIFSYCGLAGSFIFAIGVGSIFGQTFLQSEFWTMFSLAFSDGVIVLRNWDIFFLSLLETLPTMHIIIFLVPVFTMLISANFYFINKNSYKHKFIY